MSNQSFASLKLPKGATVTRVALTLPANLHIDEWQDLGTQLASFGKGVQFWLGDWWAQRDHKYGQRAKVVAKQVFPYTFETLMNYGTVCRKVKTSQRCEALDFSHHILVTKLPPEEQKKWLDRAARLKWPVHKLRLAIQVAKNAQRGSDTDTDDTEEAYEETLRIIAEIKDLIPRLEVYAMKVRDPRRDELVAEISGVPKLIMDACDRLNADPIKEAAQ